MRNNSNQPENSQHQENVYHLLCICKYFMYTVAQKKFAHAISKHPTDISERHYPVAMVLPCGNGPNLLNNHVPVRVHGRNASLHEDNVCVMMTVTIDKTQIRHAGSQHAHNFQSGCLNLGKFLSAFLTYILSLPLEWWKWKLLAR